MRPPPPQINRQFPRKAYKGLAGTQLAIGLLVMIIGFCDLAFTLTALNNCGERHWYGDDAIDPPRLEDWGQESREHKGPRGRHGPRPRDRDGSRSRESEELMIDDYFVSCEDQMMMSYPSFYASGIFTGLLLVICGSLGVGAARTKVIHRQSGLKTGFLVLNILNIFGSLVMCLVGAAEAIMITYNNYGNEGLNTLRMRCGAVISFFGAVQFILSIVSSGVGCCCSPNDEHVPMIPVMAPQQPLWMTHPPMGLIIEERGPVKEPMSDEARAREVQVQEDEKLARTLQEKLFPDAGEDRAILVDNEQTEGKPESTA